MMKIIEEQEDKLVCGCGEKVTIEHRCMRCKDTGYKHRKNRLQMEEKDRKILAEEGPRKKISKEYLMEEDEKTSDRVRSLETDLLLWKYIRGYGCKQCATPLFWNIIEDKCLNCACIEYGEEPSTRYDCRDSQCGNLRVSCSLEEEKVRKERMTMKS